MVTRRIGDEERRRRVALRHRLVPELRTHDVATIVDDLVAVHSSDPATVYMSIAARLADPTIDATAAALYSERSVVRHHAMRRTMWVMTPDVARTAHAATTRKIAAKEHQKMLGWIESVPLDDPASWLDEAITKIDALIAEEGSVTARRVGQMIPEIVAKVEIGAGTKNAVSMNLHPKVLQFGGFRGELVRTEPTGSWINSEYRWASMEPWLGRRIDDLDEVDGATQLVERYLRRFGPVTTTDVRWWSGWTAGLANKALAGCSALAVELDSGGEGWIAPDDESSVDEPAPWVAVLPGLDATTMGWKERDFYLDATMIPRLFDRFGNAGPTIWADGRVVGGWIQRDDGEIVLDVLADLSPTHRRLLDTEVERTAAHLGDTIVRPRFPSPNQKRLLA